MAREGMGGGSGSKPNTRNTTITVRPPTKFTGGPSPTAMDAHRANAGDRYAPVNNMTADDAVTNMRFQNDVINPYNPGGYPPPPGSPPGGGYGSYGGGGGGGGVPQISDENLAAIFGRKPAQFGLGKMGTWNNMELPEWNAPEYFDFNGGLYDTQSRSIDEGLARDMAAGGAAYGDARTELSQYQNPFAGRSYTQNPEMDGAMQRMMAANGVSADPTETGRGVQADAAFGNVLALLGGNADQYQASQMRALGGDERRFGESMRSQGATMKAGVEMQRAAAMARYEENKFMYGADVARRMFEDELANAQYNHQGQTQMDMRNDDRYNSVGDQNVQLQNDYNSGMQTELLSLLANGQTFDAADYAQWAPTAPKRFDDYTNANLPPPTTGGGLTKGSAT